MENYKASRQLAVFDNFNQLDIEKRTKKKKRDRLMVESRHKDIKHSKLNPDEKLQNFKLIRNFKRNANQSPKDMEKLSDNLDQTSLSRISKRSLPFFNDSSHFDNFSESLSNVM